MYVEETNTGRFAIQDLSIDELELLQTGLIDAKQHSLQDAEVFKSQRASCIEMFEKIDREIINARTPVTP